MRIGTPFTTVEPGGIECSHGVLFGGSDSVSEGATYEVTGEVTF